MPAGLVNSREWWETYFESEWLRYGGPHQTRHFMQRLVQELPLEHYESLRLHAYSILDWGCALGEGVEVLRSAFPYCFPCGLDFAARAVEEARRRHPFCEFIHTPGGSIPRPFDGIVTSNCLEHFADPLAVVRSHLSSCRRLYAALVPFEEPEPLHQFHATRFTLDTFPPEIGAWRRIALKPVEVDPVCWPGKQLLAAYSREAAIAPPGGESLR